MQYPFQLRIAFLVFLVAAGIFVRFADLGTHFSHIDDLGVAKSILTAKQEKFTPEQGKPAFEFYWRQFSAVPSQWTYAPAQFFLTTLLLHPGQSYRETLFWGRFPSFLFAVVALVLWILFYKKYDRFQTPAVSISLALIVFSWQNIVYAKQMESYAIGVFSTAALLLLLWHQLKPGNFSLRNRLAGALIAVLLSHTQYQVLFLVPAYFGTLFLHDWLHAHNKKQAIVNLLIPCLLFAALVYPMYSAFLKRQSATVGLTWNAGPASEFQFLLDHSLPFLSQLANALLFFGKNTYIVYGSMIAFMPEKGLVFEITRLLFFILFLTGIGSVALSKSERKRSLGIFFLGIAFVWVYLVCAGRLAYSPTRHSLILLPYFAYLTAEGWITILKKLRRLGKAWPRYGTIAVLLSIIIPFAFSFSSQMESRKDPFDEDRIAGILDQYQVDALYAVGKTQNPELMPQILRNHNFFEESTVNGPYTPRTNPPFKTVAFISHREKLTPILFEEMRFRTKVYFYLQKLPYLDALGGPGEYEPVYGEEKDSGVEIDPSNRTKNGANNFYFYILRRKT